MVRSGGRRRPGRGRHRREQRLALASVGGEHGRVRRGAGCEWERRDVLEHAGGDLGDVLELQSRPARPRTPPPSGRAPRRAGRARSAKYRYTVRSFTSDRAATARTVSARQSQIGSSWRRSAPARDDALARLGRPLAAQRTVVPPTRWRGVGRGAHGTTTGSVSHPRTVEVGAKRAPSSSTSHSGNRFSTSSSATRPSSRASAAPRQKCAP